APATVTITGSANGTSYAASTGLTVNANPPPPGAVGAACTATGQCDTARGLTCQTDTLLWPGGYCTKDCTADHRVCLVGSSCYPVGAQGATWFCVENCTPSSDPGVTIRSSCRDGYCCFRDAGSGVGACLATHATVCQ
ncbi:MAG TPA: hypothetical protein VGQ83_29275, partial [Polyangia bacterium]